MKKNDMYELAKIGMRERLKGIEADLHAWYREFPDVFLVPPPQLVRPELRNGAAQASPTNGHAAGTKASQLVPYLLEHGPTSQKDLAQALGLNSVGSLSSALKRRILTGEIRRVTRGTYAATAAETKPTPTKRTKRTKKSKVDVKAQRARTARVLEIVEKADGPMPGKTLAGLSGMPANAFGILISRGYLKNGPKGFTRTSKEFVV